MDWIIFAFAFSIILVIAAIVLDFPLMYFLAALSMFVGFGGAALSDTKDAAPTPVEKPITHGYDDWENLGGGLYRICDGSNLIYGFGARSITVSPNDPVCAVK